MKQWYALYVFLYPYRTDVDMQPHKHKKTRTITVTIDTKQFGSMQSGQAVIRPNDMKHNIYTRSRFNIKMLLYLSKKTPL